MKNFQVALDGPAGSGKSSISEIIAQKLGFVHIDTGAMYRAVTLEALRRNIDLSDESQYSFIDEVEIVYINNKTYINDEDVSTEIRSLDVTRNVSLVSSLRVVRQKMLIYQRLSAKNGYVLMDGRDIGTTVLPHADVKIFLTASAEERAKRRLAELNEKGINESYETILNDIKVRDYKDSHREISPLVKADDAILVDTTSMTIEEVCNTIISIVCERMDKMENKEMSMEELLKSEESRELKVHSIVKGEVIEVKDKYAKVNLNTFTEGTIYLDHFTLDKDAVSLKDLVKVGDVIEAEITKITEGENSDILLSRLNTLKIENYNNFKNVHPVESNVEAKIIKVIPNKGYILSNGQIEMFLSARDLKEAPQKGDTLNVKILSYDDNKKNAFVSRYAVIREERQHAHEEYVAKKEVEHKEYVEQREAEYKTFFVGNVVKGTVAKIVPYGVFVKFDKVQGLIRLKDVAHEFIKSASEVLTEGEEIEVKVINTDNGKLELSRKALLKTPYQIYHESHEVSDTVKGKVINKMPFGVLVELDKNVTGLLHRSEFSWNPNDNLMASLLIGDEIELSIIRFDEEHEKISLSRKPLLDNPWSRVETKEGAKVCGKITEVVEGGFVVSLLGVDAYLPFNAVDTGEKRLKATDLYQVGDDVNCIVTEFNAAKWILNLSEKAYKLQEEREQFESYMQNSEEDKTTTLGDLFKEQLK